MSFMGNYLMFCCHFESFHMTLQRSDVNEDDFYKSESHNGGYSDMA